MTHYCANCKQKISKWLFKKRIHGDSDKLHKYKFIHFNCPRKLDKKIKR